MSDEVRHDAGIYYDRDGQAITLERYAELFGNDGDDDYKRVAQDDVGELWVSTVWLGIDHAFGDGPPIIFETMIFRDGDFGRDLAMWRYTTETAALAGHDRVVAALRDGVPPEAIEL